MGRQMGLQRTGNIEILFDMFPRHQDPDYGAFMDEVKAYHRSYGAWPDQLAKDLEKAWHVQSAKLQQAKHLWQVAKGPVSALQCYLMEPDGAQTRTTSGRSRATMGRTIFRLTCFRHGWNSSKSSSVQKPGIVWLKFDRELCFRKFNSLWTGPHGRDRQSSSTVALPLR